MTLRDDLNAEALERDLFPKENSRSLFNETPVGSGLVHAS